MASRSETVRSATHDNSITCMVSASCKIIWFEASKITYASLYVHKGSLKPDSFHLIFYLRVCSRRERVVYWIHACHKIPLAD